MASGTGEQLTKLVKILAKFYTFFSADDFIGLIRVVQVFQ